MTKSVNRVYIPELDQLRAMAALLVLAYHGFQLFGAQLAHASQFIAERDWVFTANPLIAVIEEGHTGVALFFVLSGFVLTTGTLDRSIDYGLFLKSRFLRIYPIVIVLTLAASQSTPVTVTKIVSTLIPLGTTDAIDSDFTRMFWAVSIEVQCYLVFPFLIKFWKETGIRFLLYIVVLAVIVRFLAVYSTAVNPRDFTYYTIFGRVDQFIVGMVAASVFARSGWAARTPVWSLPLAAAGMVCSLWLFNFSGGWVSSARWKMFLPTVEAVAWAIFLVVYVRHANVLPKLLTRSLTWIGNVSYPLYMIHFVIIGIVLRNRIFVALTSDPHVDALVTTALVSFPLTLLVSIPLHIGIEQPFLRLRPKYVT